MLQINNVTKRYPNGHLALSGVDLSIGKGEILGIVGGSGCGKSTLLRLLCGLDHPTSGRIFLDGRPVFDPCPEIGLVFQEPRLMPWLKIADNIAFGIRTLPPEEQNSRVQEALERVGLTHHADHWPRELSGGQAQRVALARALVARPQVLLLDEPFSALDALTRADLQDHLRDLWAWTQPTMILVTHDIEEALFLADRIVIMRPNPGQICSEATPHLSHPADRHSAEFIDWKSRLLTALGHASRPPAGGNVVPAALV